MAQDLLTPSKILLNFYSAETVYMTSSNPTPDLFASTMGKHVSPNIDLYQSPDLPWGGTYTGHSGFLAWSEAMTKYFSSLEVLEPQVFEAEGVDEVVVRSTLKLVVKGSGEVWEKPLVQSVKVDREKGWITEIRPFYWDVAGLRKLLGL